LLNSVVFFLCFVILKDVKFQEPSYISIFQRGLLLVDDYLEPSFLFYFFWMVFGMELISSNNLKDLKNEIKCKVFWSLQISFKDSEINLVMFSFSVIL